MRNAFARLSVTVGLAAAALAFLGGDHLGGWLMLVCVAGVIASQH